MQGVREIRQSLVTAVATVPSSQSYDQSQSRSPIQTEAVLPLMPAPNLSAALRWRPLCVPTTTDDRHRRSSSTAVLEVAIALVSERHSRGTTGRFANEADDPNSQHGFMIPIL